MSSVTGIVLITSLTDGEEPIEGHPPSARIGALNEWLRAAGFGPLKNVASESGGTKHPQCCTFHCGYNGFPEDQFAAAVLATEWGDPENVVLVLQPEDGATRVFSGVHFDNRHVRDALIHTFLCAEIKQ